MGNDIAAGHTWADTPTGKRVDVENLNRAFSDATLKETAISARTAKSPIVLSDQFMLADGALKKATMQAIVDLVSGNLGAGAVNAAALDVTAITGQTAKTALVDADTFLVWDSEASSLKKVTRANLLGSTLITGQTEKTAIVDADTLLIWDSEASSLKKVTRANLSKNGSILQTVIATSSTYTTGTATIPTNAAPTTSNGTKISALDISITLAASTNKVELSLNVPFLSGSAALVASFAIFRGSTLVQVGGRYTTTTSYHGQFSLAVVDSPGSVGPHNYTVYFGPDSAGTIRLLGESSVLYGGSGKLTFTAKEIKA